MELMATLQAFLNSRNEKKEITLEPIIHPIITVLVAELGTEISVKKIWEKIKSTVEGRSDEKKPNEYHTLEYGTIYNNTISNILLVITNQVQSQPDDFFAGGDGLRATGDNIMGHASTYTPDNQPYYNNRWFLQSRRLCLIIMRS